MTTRKSNRKSKKINKRFRKTRSKKGGVKTRSGKETKAITVSKTIKKPKPKTPSPSPEKEKEEPVDDCPICQEPMDNVDELVTTGCKHTFHKDCLRQWCNVVHTCPVCRHKIPITCASLMPEPQPVPEPMAEMNWDAMAMAANIHDEQAMEAIVARIRNGDSSNLFGADLLGADLEGVNLSGADLEGANLEGADLMGANLQHAFLLRANLRNADLQGTMLRDANLTDANLTDAILYEANLRNADLQGANLQGANLEDANLTGANLQGANLQGAIFGNNTGTPIGLPNNINLSGGKRKVKRKSKRKTRKTRRK